MEHVSTIPKGLFHRLNVIAGLHKLCNALYVSSVLLFLSLHSPDPLPLLLSSTPPQLDDAGEITNTTIAKELSLPPVKLHCSS